MNRTTLACLLLLFTTPAYAQDTPPEAAGDIQVEENPHAKLIETAQAQVRAILQDGDSAVFDRATVATDADGRPVVCGRVDRKNSDGAYVNQRYFVVKDNAPRLLPRERWQDAWKKECGTLPAGVHELTEEEKTLQKLRGLKINTASPVEQ